MAAENPNESTMTREQLLAANKDLYEKLTERDARLEELEANLRAKTTALEDATTINSNLQKEVKQYASELKDTQDLLEELQLANATLKTGKSTAYKDLEKKEKYTNQCFEDAQAEVDTLRNELGRVKDSNVELQRTVDGANVDSDTLVQQLQAYQESENTFREANDFVNSICREFELVFTEMGRDMNPAALINHIHELHTAASRPRRKVDRKISIADELADHSDVDSIAESIDESEHGDDEPQNFPSRPVYQRNHVAPELAEDQIGEAGAQIDTDTATDDIPAQPSPQTIARRAQVAEIMAHYQSDNEPSPSNSPIHTFDYEKEFHEAIERCKRAEATLAIQTQRVDELEVIESVRAANANEANRIAAANEPVNDVAVKEGDVADAAEKLRLTNENTRLKERLRQLQDRIDETPDLEAYNALLRERASGTWSEQDADRSRSTNAKDAQPADSQKVINGAVSNSSPPEVIPVYRDVVREKTTLEWLRDAPFWWQFLLAMMFLFLCMGNLSAWMERHAWVTSNVFAMDHVRAMASQGIRGPSAATLWFEDLIGFDRTHLG